MKKKIEVLIVAAFVFCALVGCKSTDAKPEVKTEAKKESAKVTTVGDFKTTDLDGNIATKELFSAYDLTLVNVFATGCTPCIGEMPELEELSKEMLDKKVQVVGVVHDVMGKDGKPNEAQMNVAKEIRSKTGVTYPILIPDSVLDQSILKDIEGYPKTFFVDKEGNIVGEPILASNDKAGWKAEVEQRLAEVNGESK